MLGQLQAMHHWWIIYSHIEHPSFRVQKRGNVFHHDSRDWVVDYIPKVFKLVMAILNYWQFFTMMKIFVARVPIFFFLLFALFCFCLVLTNWRHTFAILNNCGKRFNFLYVLELCSLHWAQPGLQLLELLPVDGWRVFKELDERLWWGNGIVREGDLGRRQCSEALYWRDFIFLVQVGTVNVWAFSRVLKSRLIIFVIAPFAGNCFVERRVKKVFHEVGAQFCTVEVFDVGRTVDYMPHVFGEWASSSISFGVVVRAVEVVRSEQAGMISLLAFPSLEDPQIRQHLLANYYYNPSYYNRIQIYTKQRHF